MTTQQHIPLYCRGAYSTKFGELWDKSLEDLAKEATEGVLENAGIPARKVDAIFVSNMAAEQFEGQAHLGALVSSFFTHVPPAVRVEAACASGGVAVIQAEQALLSGLYTTVLVVGVEKMTDSTNQATEILSAAAHRKREYGSTFPGLYALLTKAYTQKYGEIRDVLSAISVKNHSNALTNPNAQFHKKITSTMVEKSPLVADPLRMLDCSPLSDGAAAILLSTEPPPNTKYPVQVVGFGQGQDSLDLAHRSSLTSLRATKRAAKVAYARAGCTAKDIEVAEVHDCFTTAELLAMEDLGFCREGTAPAKLRSKKTSPKQKINLSGGLKASGHPVGATGVKQVAYLYSLLSEGKYTTALAHNVGGSGATAVVHILSTKKGKK